MPGIGSTGRAHELAEEVWQDVIGVNLTGGWHTAKAAIPHLIGAGRRWFRSSSRVPQLG
jgi:(+)-trans-carveol dehydrogenase